MSSILNATFIVKHDFHKTIKQYSKVKIITIINDCCLVEDINTNERLWLMKYDIYPINYDNSDYSGYWEKNNYFDNLYMALGLTS